MFPKVPQSSLGILRVPQLPPPVEHPPLGTLQHGMKTFRSKLTIPHRKSTILMVFTRKDGGLFMGDLLGYREATDFWQIESSQDPSQQNPSVLGINPRVRFFKLKLFSKHRTSKSKISNSSPTKKIHPWLCPMMFFAGNSGRPWHAQQGCATAEGPEGFRRLWNVDNRV